MLREVEAAGGRLHLGLRLTHIDPSVASSAEEFEESSIRTSGNFELTFDHGWTKDGELEGGEEEKEVMVVTADRVILNLPRNVITGLNTGFNLIPGE